MDTLPEHILVNIASQDQFLTQEEMVSQDPLRCQCVFLGQ